MAEPTESAERPDGTLGPPGGVSCELARLLHIARLARHVSRNDLANILAVHPSTVRNWERGFRLPRDLILSVLAETLGLNLAEVVACYERDRKSRREAHNQAGMVESRKLADADPEVRHILKERSEEG